MQQRRVCIVSHLLLVWDPARPGVKFRNPLTCRSWRAANITHSALQKSTWFAVEEGSLHRRCRAAREDICGRARQFPCECAAGCVWSAAIPPGISAARASKAWLWCWSGAVVQRKTEPVLAYGKPNIKIILLLVWATWTHHGEITWHKCSCSSKQTKSETREIFFFFFSPSYSVEGINHSLWRAAEHVYKEHEKANMESSWSAGTNMTYWGGKEKERIKKRGDKSGSRWAWRSENRIDFYSLGKQQALSIIWLIWNSGKASGAQCDLLF